MAWWQGLLVLYIDNMIKVTLKHYAPDQKDQKARKPNIKIGLIYPIQINKLAPDSLPRIGKALFYISEANISFFHFKIHSL